MTTPFRAGEPMTEPDVRTAIPAARSEPTPGELLTNVTTDLSALMRQEIALAKAEASQSAKSAGSGVGMLGGAAIAGHLTLLFLSVAAWWAMGNEIGRSWSALIVMGAWAVVALVLAVVGKNRLQHVQGMPQTTDSIKEIPNAIKGHEENNR